MSFARPAPKASKLRILIVEDEPFIALSLSDALFDLGFSIAGCFADVRSAMDFINREHVDGALLDVNLGSQKIDPVADLLAKRACPFIFTTGCGRSGIPAAFADRAVLQKPFGIDDLAGALQMEFGAAEL